MDRYDENGDGVLTADEWNGISASLGLGDAGTDANGDDKLAVEEIAARLKNR